MSILEETYEKDLLVKLSRGNEEAFNALYKAYSKPLYYRVLRLVKITAIAEELLQDLFIKVWDKRASLDTEKSFQAFLYTVAQNIVYNYFRKVASDQTMMRRLISNATEHYLNGQELLENKETGEALQRAINNLSPQRKQVFQLCKLEGRSYEEAAKIMGISTATVNSHMTKSLQSIKTYILKNQDIALILLSTCTVDLFQG